MTALIEVKDVSKAFGGVIANNKISMEVPEGRVTGLIGPNGSGKTTLFNSIVGYHPIDEGSIKFQGREISDMLVGQIARLGLLRTFQQTRIYSKMDCVQNMLISVPHRNENFKTMFQKYPAEVTDKDDKPDDSNLKSALAQKEHFRKKLKEAEARLAKANKPTTETALDVEDYIDISTSLSGLDPVEQAFLAKQHKLTGESMKEIRESEDFQLWNSAYRAKQEKENALKPNATQEREDAPASMVDKLRTASIAEKEELLKQSGLYKDNRPSPNRVDIGNKISTQ